ncbi:TIGR04197 family type VII secretion effector [Streptococcus marimammalium]|uniref:TIGR04197 family type VII secretion effector n=1 Tax=Streptococcus marimammalium TaxID=269666 RepID=UPI0003650688|nr:TIGR04197 family type VII secretion effector [Streptococcus marimammalium]
MSVLQNNTTLASQRATELANGISNLVTSGTVTKDMRTTVAGNIRAQKAIELVKSTESQIANIILTMSGNINSLSSSFQAMDKQLGSQLSKFDKPATRFTLNE